jgi:hypothetical protein
MTASLRKSAQMALDALNKLWLLGDKEGALANPAIKSLRAALAVPDEPVAFQAFIATLPSGAQENIRDAMRRGESHTADAFAAGFAAAPQPVPVERQPLMMQDLWESDALMSLNAGLDLSMDELMRFVDVIEDLHGIRGAA